MKYEVIYEQKVRQQARWVVECESEDALNDVLDKTESDMNKRGFDRLDDFDYLLKNKKGIKVIEFEEEYFEEWDAPEYYDHNKVGH